MPFLQLPFQMHSIIAHQLVSNHIAWRLGHKSASNLPKIVMQLCPNQECIYDLLIASSIHNLLCHYVNPLCTYGTLNVQMHV